MYSFEQLLKPLNKSSTHSRTDSYYTHEKSGSFSGRTTKRGRGGGKPPEPLKEETNKKCFI